MCITNKYGRPSSICLVPLALATIVLGGGLVGSWVSCYYKCVRGQEVEYNYYAAVWTGGLAILSGVFQLFLACCWNRALKYLIVFLNVVVLLCCLLCGALYSYITYLEVQITPASEVAPTIGMILSGLQAVLAVFIMFFVMIWTCVIACTSGTDDRTEDYRYADTRPKRTSRSSRPRGADPGPYDTSFFNREPSIYRGDTLERQRPQEVSYGQPSGRSGGGGGAPGSTYIIPRASLRGAPNGDSQRGNGRRDQDNSHQSNGYQGNGRRSHPGGAMVVDGRESLGRYGNGGEDNRGFYSGSNRFSNSLPRSSGGARQNGGAQVPNGSAYQSSTGGRGQYPSGVSLMQMHGVAPTHNINEGYY